MWLQASLMVVNSFLISAFEETCKLQSFLMMVHVFVTINTVCIYCFISIIINFFCFQTRIVAKVTMSNKASGSNSMSIQSSGSKSINVADHNGELFLEQLDTGVSGTIVVMISRMWDVNATSGRYLSTDFVVSDAKVSKHTFTIMHIEWGY